MAKDPPCGMQVTEKAGIILEHKGKTKFFYSENCKNKLVKK